MHQLRITGYTKVVVRQKDCQTLEDLTAIINKQIFNCFGKDEELDSKDSSCDLIMRVYASGEIRPRMRSSLNIKFYIICKSSHLFNDMLKFPIAHSKSKVLPSKTMYNTEINKVHNSTTIERLFYPVTRIGKVQSNLIDHRYDGNRFTQVMDYIDVRSMSKVNNAYQVYHIPSVNYHRLVDDKIENIHIEIIDQDNEYINMTDGVTVVILKFRRVN